MAPMLKAGRHLHVENRELLTGDCLLLVAFCLYKQVHTSPKLALIIQSGMSI